MKSADSFTHQPKTLPREFPGAIWYQQEEVEAVERVIRAQSPFRYYGPSPRFEVDQLEQEFARYLESEPDQVWPEESSLFVTAVNSGTGALEVALDALGVGDGDEVIVQGFMWISTISAIVRCRAIPVLIDSDATLNIDPYDLRARISARTKVVIPVPMLGGCAQIGILMEEIRKINQERIQLKLPVIRVLEDCAQALGARALGQPGSIEPTAPSGAHRVGTFGDVGIYSLQINKNITAGEGGLIVTRSQELHRKIEALHNCGYAPLGMQRENWYGDEFVGWGHGRRMSELQGAVARAQLKRLDKIIDQMRTRHNALEQRLPTLGLIPRPRADSLQGDTGYYLCFSLPQEKLSEEQQITRGRQFSSSLEKWDLKPWFMHDFEIHVYYNISGLVDKVPLNQRGPWSKNTVQYQYQRGALPRLDQLLINTIGINIPSLLSESDLDYVESALRSALKTIKSY